MPVATIDRGSLVAKRVKAAGKVERDALRRLEEIKAQNRKRQARLRDRKKAEKPT